MLQSAWISRNMKELKWLYNTYDKFIMIPPTFGVIIGKKDDTFHCFNVGDTVRIEERFNDFYNCRKDDMVQAVSIYEVSLC